MTAAELAERLGGRANGSGWIASCPAHDDSTPSLTIDDGRRGVVVHCQAGCEQRVVIAALRDRGLWPTAADSRREAQIVATYPYHDESGELLYEVVRFEPKDFRQRRPDGAGGWIWKLGDVRRVLYRLPELVEADPERWVIVAEGEKDVEALTRQGLVATTNAGGAGKWKHEYTEALRGRRVCILPDKDESGRKHAEMVRQALEGIAREVKVLELPVGKDASDWLAAGHDGDQLLELVEKAGGALADPPSLWPPGLDLAELAGREPELPRFILDRWLPVGYATLFGGHGGAGKSSIALYLAVCIAAGRDFFGIGVAPRRVTYLACEDRAALLHWRLTRIAAHIGIDLASLAGWLEVIDLVGRDAVLWDRDPIARSAITPPYLELAMRVRAYASELLIVDGTADTFGGSENARADVKRFVNALVALVPEASGAVLLVTHVSKPTAQSGNAAEGYSGSTGWHNSARARWYLYPELREEDGGTERTGDLILELQKSNLGRADQRMRFRWDEDAHLFLGRLITPPTRLDRQHRDRREQDAIVETFRAVEAIGDYVPAATTGSRTAFHVLSAQPIFPDSLRGNSRADRARFWRHVEALRRMGTIGESSIRRADRKKTITLELVSEAPSSLRPIGV